MTAITPGCDPDYWEVAAIWRSLGSRHTWPELQEAVVELEVALSVLTIENGGML